MTGSIHKQWGRTRQRLAASLLAEHGFKVATLRAAQGALRNNKSIECYVWEATGTDAAGMISTIASFSTMTDCLRYGYHFAWDNGWYDVTAKRPCAPREPIPPEIVGYVETWDEDGVTWSNNGKSSFSCWEYWDDDAYVNVYENAPIVLEYDVHGAMKPLIIRPKS